MEGRRMALLDRYKNFRPFTDDEAWLLFKIAAIAEGVGWMLLIGGVLCERYLLPGSIVPVKITGQLHGTAFLAYMTGSIVLSPSMGWSTRRTLVAGLCSVPPFGSVVFELWAARQRKRGDLVRLSNLIYYRWLVA